MSEPRKTEASREASFANWEERAAGDLQTREERQATEIFLAALGLTPTFADKVFLKGGILVGAVYESGRNTADLDFSTALSPSYDFPDRLQAELEAAIPVATATLGFPEKLLRLQSVRFRPRRETFVEANAPAIEVRFGYADAGTRQAEKLLARQCNQVIYADISFNEPIELIERIIIAGTELSFYAYSKCDLIAEKLRALLQQKIRERNRRQDVFDLHYIITSIGVSDTERRQIARTFKRKCAARDITPAADSLNDPEIRSRAQVEWHTLAAEVDNLPPFEIAYESVLKFYSSLDLAI